MGRGSGKAARRPHRGGLPARRRQSLGARLQRLAQHQGSATERPVGRPAIGRLGLRRLGQLKGQRRHGQGPPPWGLPTRSDAPIVPPPRRRRRQDPSRRWRPPALRTTRRVSAQRLRCCCTNPGSWSPPRSVSLLLLPRTPQRAPDAASGYPSHLPLRDPPINTLATIFVYLSNPTGFVAHISRPERRQCRQRVQVSAKYLVVVRPSDSITEECMGSWEHQQILQAALDPAIASKARRGAFVTCCDHFDLLQTD